MAKLKHYLGTFLPLLVGGQAVTFAYQQHSSTEWGPFCGPVSGSSGDEEPKHEPPDNGGPCDGDGVSGGCPGEAGGSTPEGGDCGSDGEGGAGGPGSAGDSPGDSGGGIQSGGSFPDFVNVNAVLKHSGQEMWQETDIALKGVDHAVGISLMRRHLSKFGNRDQTSLHGDFYFPMFGRAWTCNYQRLLWRNPVLASPDVIYEEAFDRVNEFQFVPGNLKVWNGVDDTTDKVIWDRTLPGSAPRILLTGGVQLIFSEFEEMGDNGAEAARLELIRSPNGNTIKFEYLDEVLGLEPTSPEWQQIASIEDSFGARTPQGGRKIDFDYIWRDGRRVVSEITDFDGRKTSYSYHDGGGHPVDSDLLESVSEPNARDFNGANRAKTSYSYGHSVTDAGDALLEFNLTQVIAPNENQQGYDVHYAKFDYETTGFFKGSLLAHTMGDEAADEKTGMEGLSAGGTSFLEYSLETGYPSTGDPYIRTVLTTVRGVSVVYGMSYGGQMLFETFQGWSGGTPRMPIGTQRGFSITAEGNTSASTGAMGDGLEVAYASSFANYPSSALVYLNDQRSAAGLQTLVKRTPDSRTSDQTSIVTETIYEPVFNQPFQVRDERGFVTTYIYDYMENLDSSMPELEALLGYDNDPFWIHSGTTTRLRHMVDQMIANAWVSVSGEANSGDLNGDGTGARCGLVVKKIFPTVSIPGQVSQYTLGTSPLGASQAAFELFRYNSFAQPTWYQDAEGNTHEYTYYPDDNVAGDVVLPGETVAPQGPGSDKGGGYVRSFVLDTSSDPSRNSGTGETAQMISNYYAYRVVSGDQVGASVGQLQYSRSRPTSVFDGQGTRYDSHINSLDQVVRHVRASDSAGLGYYTEYSYDANGNQILTLVEDPNAEAGETSYVAKYNVLNALEETVEDAEGRRVRKLYSYDASLNLVQIQSVDEAVGVADLERSPIERYAFDERNLPVSATRGFGAATESTATTAIDPNGNIVGVSDGTGESITYIFDGFDRVREIVKRDGTRHSYVLDPAGNRVSETVLGSVETLSSSGTPTSIQSSGVLAGSRAFFDERNRPFLLLESMLQIGGPGHDVSSTPGVLAANIPQIAPGEIPSLLIIYDKLDRPILELDADADALQRRFDGLGRATLVQDPLGNTSLTTYDDNHMPSRVVDEDFSTLNPGASETFTYFFDHDPLSRLTSIELPNGETTILKYNSRDQLIKRTDELGRAVSWTYDALARLRSKTTVLGSASEGGDPDLTGIGQPDGLLTVSMSWDNLGRMSLGVDDRGNVTEQSYDALHRVSKITYGDGTTERLLYSPVDELIGRIGQAGDRHLYTHDPEGRVETARHFLPTGPGGSDIRGSSFQRWTWDGLGRNWAHLDDNGPGAYNDVVVAFGFDRLGRVTGEMQSLGGSSSAPTWIRYEGASSVVDQRYPSNRRVRRSFDGLDRLTSVTDLSANTPVAPAISSYDYIGRYRIDRQQYRNGAVLDQAFDANRRSVEHSWRYSGSGATITKYLTKFNGPNGVGTGRRISEERVHLQGGSGVLGGRRDQYDFDHAYRMTGFHRETHDGMSVVGMDAIAKLDGVDKMFEYVEYANSGGALIVDHKPAIDQHPDPKDNGLNQYSSFDSQSLEYDHLGGLQGTYRGKELRFDSQKRLSRLLESGLEVMEYAYDASNRRIAKIDTSSGQPLVSERYFYNGAWQVLEEQDGSGRWTKQFVDGNDIDEHLQYRVNLNPNAGSPVWLDLYYHSNDQGSVGALTAASGTRIEYVEYSWFGQPAFIAPSGELADGDRGTPGVQPLTQSRTGNPYLFQGRRLDPETGLYHFRNRQYDPVTGEFISVDPAGLWHHGQGNGYSAFDGDPINLRDPFGLSPQDGSYYYGGSVIPVWSGPTGSGGQATQHLPSTKQALTVASFLIPGGVLGKVASKVAGGLGRLIKPLSGLLKGGLGKATEAAGKLGALLGKAAKLLPELRHVRASFFKFQYGGRGGGFLLKHKGKRFFGIDWHRFHIQIKPWPCPKDIRNRLHFHFGKGAGGNRHWPWQTKGTPYGGGFRLPWDK